MSNYNIPSRASDAGPNYESFDAPDEPQIDIDEADEEPDLCPVRHAIFSREHATVGDMMDALKAHQAAECIVCGSGHKTAQRDREIGSRTVRCAEVA